MSDQTSWSISRLISRYALISEGTNPPSQEVNRPSVMAVSPCCQYSQCAGRSKVALHDTKSPPPPAASRFAILAHKSPHSYDAQIPTVAFGYPLGVSDAAI